MAVGTVTSKITAAANGDRRKRKKEAFDGGCSLIRFLEYKRRRESKWKKECGGLPHVTCMLFT